MEVEPSAAGPEPVSPAVTFAPRLRWSDVVARMRRPATGWLLAFTVTLFLSSALLFAVQPMVAKMILPLLGGAPATWIASMLFFQTALLAGYAYAHASTRWLRSRGQLVVHAVLLLLSLLALPIALPRGWQPDSAGDPVAWLLLLLVVTVGLPFFLVCSTGPLLQQWFTSTPHASAQDPYFLYRASNVGSMLALLAYPVLIEPRLRLADQGELWAVAYIGLVALTFVCAVVRWRTPVEAARAQERSRRSFSATTADGSAPDRLTAARRLRWVVLAFVPSIFMLAVTTHITTDIAAVPLLWVIPLALYLLSFVVAFSPRPSIFSALISQAQPFLMLQLVLFIVLRVTEPVSLVLAANLLALFVSALVCHGRLAEDRPPSRQLTEFYLWIALGGALGGVFNAVAAPLLFDTVVEYPLAIVLACVLGRPRPGNPDGEDRRRRYDILLPLGVGVLYVSLVALGRAVGLDPFVARAPALLLAVVLCATFIARPVRFGLGVGAILVAAALPFWSPTDTLYSERTFFGVLRVDRDEDHRLHRMVHGNTVHGAQSTESGRRLEPISYYTAPGPVFDLPGTAATPEVAVIGLGTGSLACHGRPTQHWTFYEIDPAVERLARDPSLFTYLRDCPPESDVVLGDARRSLSRTPGHKYGVIVVDAFNSDAIPVHLLTREALALYVDRLADGGVIAVNVTNRYLDLTGVVAALARDARLVTLVRDDLDITDAETDKGKSGSMWVVMARSPADLAPLATGTEWVPLSGDQGSEVWTDDFSNLLGAFKRG